MSNAIPAMLTHAQRGESFTAALALEDGLKELEDLKARLLAELEAMADAMRQKHARLMRAATTGVSPEAPEQQPLPLADASPVSPVQAPAAVSADEDKPPPSSPSGKSRSHSRKGEPEEKGTKRAAASSARTASSAQANTNPGAEVDDSVPAPRVPCCECGDSVADHKDGTGRCLRVRGMSKCKCKRFTPAAVDLAGAPGWKVRPCNGSLSTGRGGEQGCTIVGIWRGGEAETTPVWWVPGYGLAFQDGAAVSCVYSYLGEGATTLTYEKDTRWNWVPRPVLRAVAEHLGATWPEKRAASKEPAPAAAPTEEVPRAEATPDTPDTPCECDGCGGTFKASELQPVGEGESRGFYCATCKAEVDDFDTDEVSAAGSTTQPGHPVPAVAALVPEVATQYPYFSENKVIRHAENRAGWMGAALPVPPEFSDVDRTALLDAHEGPREQGREYKDELELSATYSACMACATRSGPRARLSLSRYSRPVGGKSWRPDKDSRVSGMHFSVWLCRPCCTPEGMKRADARRWSEEAPVADAPVAPPKDLLGREWPAVNEARFPGWFVWVIHGVNGNPDSIAAGRLHELFFDMDLKGPGDVEIRHLRWFPANGGSLCVGPHTEPREFALAAFPPGLYAALVDYLSTHWPLPAAMVCATDSATNTPPSKPRRSRKAKVAQALVSEAALCGNVNPKTGVRCADPAGHDGGWHHGPSEAGSGARLRWKNKDYQYVGPNTGHGEAAGASTPGAWRVELPERNDGHTIVRLWLVNDASGERTPATWWSGVSSLRRSHHLSGRLEGEQLAAHLELESWWMANADTVIKPLVEACREGEVPGLKVYEPETFGPGPHKYALSNGWTLETWEAEDGEGADNEKESTAHFTRPTARPDVWERFGPFVLSPDGHLTTGDTETSDWSAENEGVVAEAEDFIRRGFIFEMHQEVVA